MRFDEAQCSRCGTVKKMYLMVVIHGQWVCTDCDPLCEPVEKETA